MSKNKTGKATGRKTVKKVVKGRPAVETLPGMIQVLKATEAFKGARAAWYATLREHDGKSAADFLSACAKKPPALPKNGKGEDPKGWLKFFVRSGIATVS